MLTVVAGVMPHELPEPVVPDSGIRVFLFGLLIEVRREGMQWLVHDVD